jgi:hypothetical protein
MYVSRLIYIFNLLCLQTITILEVIFIVKVFYISPQPCPKQKNIELMREYDNYYAIFEH